MTQIKKVMTTSVVSVSKQASASNIAALMKEKEVGVVPVVEDQSTKLVVGIISDRDLALKVIGSETTADRLPVHDLMTASVFTCRAEEEIDEVLSRMRTFGVRRMPVTTASGHLLGIVSQSDIAGECNKRETRELLAEHVARSAKQ